MSDPLVIEIEPKGGYLRFIVKVGNTKGELWTLPFWEEAAIIDAIVELERAKT